MKEKEGSFLAGFKEEEKLKNKFKIENSYMDDIIMELYLTQDHQSKDILIRKMEKIDINTLVSHFSFPWTTVQSTIEKWTRYYNEHEKKIRTVYVLEKGREMIGYASLLHISEYPHFKNAGIPEINDVWIAKDWRSKGYGKMLIQFLEHSAFIDGYQKIGLGVGLYADYGRAQQLYFRLGYVPNGYGVTYNYEPAVPGKSYPLDDELILWLTKNL